MRIIAGEFKGHVVDSPSEKTTRPTTDRVRESIFSSIFSRLPELDDTNVLDAFAGSGALGIEALSRGALACVFVERDAAARRVLEGNLARLRLAAPRVRVLKGDVFGSIPALLSAATQPFGLVLLDPPYATGLLQVHELLSALADAELLADECVVAYEHALDNKAQVADEFASDERFELSGQKKYGKIGVTYFSYESS